MVVDDYPFMRDLLGEILLRAKYEVVGTASTAAELMEGLAAWKPDFIVLDIRLPDADGFEVSRRVLAADPKVKVLLISGLDEDAKLTAQCIAAGARGFLGKPFSTEALVKALAAL